MVGDELRFIGIQLGSKMSWNKHITKVADKAKKKDCCCGKPAKYERTTTRQRELIISAIFSIMPYYGPGVLVIQDSII